MTIRLATWTLGLAILATSASATAQTITLKVHHFLGPQSIQHTKMLADWCANLARDSNNRLHRISVGNKRTIWSTMPVVPAIARAVRSLSTCTHMR